MCAVVARLRWVGVVAAVWALVVCAHDVTASPPHALDASPPLEVPFFRRSSSVPHPMEATWVTVLHKDDLVTTTGSLLLSACAAWNGPVALVLFVPVPPPSHQHPNPRDGTTASDDAALAAAHADIRGLERVVAALPWVDVHVAFAAPTLAFPLASLIEQGVRLARTHVVWYAPPDALPSPGLRQRLFAEFAFDAGPERAVVFPGFGIVSTDGSAGGMHDVVHGIHTKVDLAAGIASGHVVTTHPASPLNTTSWLQALHSLAPPFHERVGGVALRKPLPRLPGATEGRRQYSRATVDVLVACMEGGLGVTMLHDAWVLHRDASHMQRSHGPVRPHAAASSSAPRRSRGNTHLQRLFHRHGPELRRSPFNAAGGAAGTATGVGVRVTPALHKPLPPSVMNVPAVGYLVPGAPVDDTASGINTSPLTVGWGRGVRVTPRLDGGGGGDGGGDAGSVDVLFAPQEQDPTRKAFSTWHHTARRFVVVCGCLVVVGVVVPGCVSSHGVVRVMCPVVCVCVCAACTWPQQTVERAG